MKRFQKILSVLLVMLLTAVNTFAQTDCGPGQVGGGGDPDDPNVPNTPCDVPLDTWIYALVIAAVVFGAYQLHKKSKNLVTLA